VFRPTSGTVALQDHAVAHQPVDCRGEKQVAEGEPHMSLERISELISRGRYLDVLTHPRQANHRMFSVCSDSYVWVVPYVYEAGGETISLKTLELIGRKKTG
jgi:hypothetical protein